MRRLNRTAIAALVLVGVLAEPLTTEQWKLLYADWQEERQAALRKRIDF